MMFSVNEHRPSLQASLPSFCSGSAEEKYIPSPACGRGAGVRVSAVHRGFTLVELLVVLFIISIVTSVALLSISRNEQKDMESYANEVTQMLTLAEQQAMLQPTVIGFRINQNTLQFTTMGTQANNKPQWSAINDSVLKARSIPSNYDVRIEMGNEKNNPQIVISSNGDLTPFTIYIGKRGKKPSFVIKGDADGNVTNQAIT